MDNFRDSYFQVDWDLTAKRLRGTYWGKQYDTGRGFAVTVINGGQVVTPTTEVLRLKWEKPDNTTGYVNATIVNGKFIVENIDQMFTVHGSVRADFELSVGGKFVASITFYVSVEKAVAVDAIESSSDFTALQDALADVGDMQAQVDAVIANATVDSEVILARGTEATLGARLDSIEQKQLISSLDFNLPSGLKNEVIGNDFIVRIKETVINGTGLTEQSASHTSTHYRFNSAPISDIDRDIKEGVGYSDDGNFPLNTGSAYIGTSRQMFAFVAATVFSVEKSKIDSMDGNNVLEKAVAYFNFYPVRVIYKIAVEKVIKINTLSFNTQEILRLRSSAQMSETKQEIIDARDGEISLGANIRNKAENVILKNQIKNGNFKNPVNFETDWNRGTIYSTLITEITSDEKLSVSSTSAYEQHYLNSRDLELRAGDKYYFRYTISENVNGTPVRVQCFDDNGALLQPPIAHENSIGTHSMTGVAHENTAFAQLNFSLVAAGRKLVIDNIVFFNLTAIFGAGNEPTTDEVDALINNYPEGYIEGGVTLWDMRDTNQAIKEIRESLNPSVEIEKLGDISKAKRFSSDHEIQDIDDYYRHINNGDFNGTNFFRQTGVEGILSGHKYLIDVIARSFPRDMQVGFGNSENNSVTLKQSSEFTQVRKVIDVTQSYENFGGYMFPPSGAAGNYVDIKKDAGFYDLTEFFGAGNEPTQAEFDEMVNLYPNADTETLVLKLRTEGIKLLRDELKRTQVALNNHKDRNKIDFNEMRADFEGMLNPVDNIGYYYRGKPAPSILVGDKALSYESFIANTWELLREENPEYITRNTIIKDTSGTFDIYEYVFEPETYSKTVFLIGGVHGDEHDAFWGLYYFMKKIVEDTDNHERMSSLKDNIRFVIIPIVNPWGVERQTRGNSRGINTNHNYDVTFGVEGYVSEGSAPFSESESTAVKMVAEKYNSEFDLFIDFHTDPYSPSKGNYITIAESSSLWATGVQITLDEIAHLRDTYGFTTTQRPAIVNVSTGNGAWRYMELVKGVPSLIWETSVGGIAKTGTSKMMTIGIDWMINVFTEMLKVE